MLPSIKDIIKTRLLAAIEGQDGTLELDIIETFAHPVPAQILKDMLGLDEIPLVDFLRWSDSIALFMQDFVVSQIPNNKVAMQTALDLNDMVDAFRKSIELRKTVPCNDLLSSLVGALDSSPHKLTENELCYQLIHLIFGGHKIPQFVISNTLNLLFQNPEVLERLGDGTVKIRDIVNESVRLEGPIQFITRHATEDFELGGKQIAKGDSIFLMLGAAHRDPLAFEDPDEFAPHKKRCNSLAFDSGAHVCIGATLVAAELEEIFTALLNADFPDTQVPVYCGMTMQHNFPLSEARQSRASFIRGLLIGLHHIPQISHPKTGPPIRSRYEHTYNMCQLARLLHLHFNRADSPLWPQLCLRLACHDIGHTPYGHAGERVIQCLYDSRFSNSSQSKRYMFAGTEDWPKPDIFNSDQGSQFSSGAWIDVLTDAKIKISMDEKCAWLANRMIERLWRSLKYECVHLNAFETGSEMRAGIGKWLSYYDTQCPHSAHGILPPDEAYASKTQQVRIAA